MLPIQKFFLSKSEVCPFLYSQSYMGVYLCLQQVQYNEILFKSPEAWGGGRHGIQEGCPQGFCSVGLHVRGLS